MISDLFMLMDLFFDVINVSLNHLFVEEKSSRQPNLLKLVGELLTGAPILEDLQNGKYIRHPRRELAAVPCLIWQLYPRSTDSINYDC